MTVAITVASFYVLSRAVFASHEVTSYTLELLEPPKPNGISIANSINANGIVTGYVNVGSDTRACIWVDKNLMLLPMKGNVRYADATSISDNGVIVGTLFSQDLVRSAAMWSTHTNVRLLSPQDVATANCIDPDGHCVVGAVDETVAASRATLWTDGIPKTIGPPGSSSVALGINRRGEIVGSFCWSHGNPEPFSYSGGTLRRLGLPEGTVSGVARDISEHGEIIADCRTSYGQDISYRYSKGHWRYLNPNGVGDCHAGSINRDGVVVGWFIKGNEERAFVCTGTTIVDLNSLITPRIGLVLAEANGINERGQIAGMAMQNGKPVAYRLTPQH